VNINYHLYNEHINCCNIYGSYWSQRWWSWKKCVMQRNFLYHAQVIIAILPQIKKYVGFEYFLKQKSTSVSNSSGLCSK